ncbi:MAG: tRNA pseudouridine(55) synthase TruB [Candidatus Competibacterales bacterium]
MSDAVFDNTQRANPEAIKPPKRNIDGVLLVDKPSGPTSNAVLQRVKGRLNARKAGHTGSLDPMATGLLPLCLGEATKLSSYLLDADKHYHFTAQLGVCTDTGDADGTPVATRRVPPLTREDLTAILADFSGEQLQIPPMYSALKHHGQRLYTLARRGETVERPPRRVTIHRLVLLDGGQDWFAAYVHCTKGTYIRTLALDIGEALGCGAHLVALRRTGAGPFVDAPLVTLAAVEDDPEGVLARHLLPVDTAVAHWPALHLEEAAAARVCSGQTVALEVPVAAGWVRLYRGSDAFIGLGEVVGHRVRPKRLMATA